MLKVENLDVSYGDVQVLWGISFHVDLGELVAIIGANGAGKTTTLKSIAGVLPAMSGKVTYNDSSILNTPAPEILTSGVSLVPEGRQIFPRMTALENLQLGAYIKRAKEKRSQLLGEIFELFPVLYERRRQAAGTLSGGEQQMLSVARSLMSDPSLIMLDEPSLGLAPKIVQSIFEAIVVMKERRGITTLIVEQDVRKALTIADRAYVMENGHIVKEGPAAELKNDPDIKKAYLGL